jgi:hypothetical protein
MVKNLEEKFVEWQRKKWREEKKAYRERKKLEAKK